MCEQVLRIPLSYFGVCGKTQRNVCIRRNGKESLSLRQKQCVVRYAEVEYSVVMCGTVPVVRIRTGNRCRNCTGTKSPAIPSGRRIWTNWISSSTASKTGMFPARRGIGDEEWQQGVEAVGNRADVFFDDYDGYYVYIWKYLGLLQRDSLSRFRMAACLTERVVLRTTI